MKTSACCLTVATLIAAVLVLPVRAQNQEYQPGRVRTYAGDVSRPLTAPSRGAAAVIVSSFLFEHGIAVPASSLATAGDPISAQNGVTIVQLTQLVAGLRLYGVYAKASFTAQGELIHLIENLVPNAPRVPAAARINESQALNAALARLYPGARIATIPARREGQTVVFERVPFFHDSPAVTRVAFVATDGSIGTGFLVDTWSEQQNLLHNTLVGMDGAVLFVEPRTNSDSYNVFPIDPSKTPQTVVAGPGSGNAESPAGWLFIGAENSISIAGNNAHAYLDTNNNDRADSGGFAITNGDFLASADLTADPGTPDNQEVSVQNLFYLNNRLHDVLYAHGFTEAAGNFQESNFSNGGNGSDSVNAEAQDGGGLDNANFATPPDGRNPRMQMYLFSGPGPFYQVIINSPTAAVYGAAGAAFGPQLTVAGLTGDVVLVNDGVGATTDGCEGAQAAVSGKIALVDRGACNFTVKVLNAQAAGAVAVIVANNVGATTVFTMGAGDNSFRRIRIPAVMISQNDGAALKALAAPNATLRKNPNPPPRLDGSFDSDIVYHEYGHGLTWRMIGGMSGPLAGAAGEGASDSLAMILNGDDRIGEWAIGDPVGFRRFPYHDYPLTYGDVTGEEVHNDGEIYAAIIWRLIELFNGSGVGIDTLLSYFVDGMNFTPATPAYEDLRDGILQSAANAGGAHTCLVWQAFAHYGVGVGASGTVSRQGVVTITESFELPPACPAP